MFPLFVLDIDDPYFSKDTPDRFDIPERYGETSTLSFISLILSSFSRFYISNSPICMLWSEITLSFSLIRISYSWICYWSWLIILFCCLTCSGSTSLSPNMFDALSYKTLMHIFRFSSSSSSSYYESKDWLTRILSYVSFTGRTLSPVTKLNVSLISLNFSNMLGTVTDWVSSRF